MIDPGEIPPGPPARSRRARLRARRSARTTRAGHLHAPAGPAGLPAAGEPAPIPLPLDPSTVPVGAASGAVLTADPVLVEGGARPDEWPAAAPAGDDESWPAAHAGPEAEQPVATAASDTWPAAEASWPAEAAPAPEAGWSAEATPAPEPGWPAAADHVPEAGWPAAADHVPEAEWPAAADHVPEAEWPAAAAPAPEAGWPDTAADHVPDAGWPAAPGGDAIEPPAPAPPPEADPPATLAERWAARSAPPPHPSVTRERRDGPPGPDPDLAPTHLPSRPSPAAPLVAPDWPSAGPVPSRLGEAPSWSDLRVPAAAGGGGGTLTLTAPDEPSGRADDTPPGASRRSATRNAVEWVVIIGAALVAALVIKTYLLQAFYIPSSSMEPTLNIQDRVLVNKLSYRLHDIRRGDVVVFERPPNDVGEIRDLIKRVVALPGETVEGRDGGVFIDGRLLAEPYLPNGTATADFGPKTIPSGYLWVMGDNRGNSSDSRVFGAISQDRVIGRAFVRVWPVKAFGLL